MGPQHHDKFQKKLKSQFQEIFRTEGQTDLIHRTVLAMARSSIREALLQQDNE